jgi:proline iminopeptidase
MAMARKFVTGVGVAAGVYGWWVRPRLMRWGATEAEATGPFSGAEVVLNGRRSSTMAVTIDASPEQVWPWLVQLGWDRGGWYSWDRLDNAGRPSATEVHPEWQNVAVGDQLSFWALGRRIDAYRIGVLEPNRFLGLYGYTTLAGRWLDRKEPRPASYMEGIWGFQLNELAGGRTRLVISGYQTYRPRWIERFVADWVVLPTAWIMQARMLVVLKRNIERATRAQARTVTVSQDGPANSHHLSASA